MNKYPEIMLTLRLFPIRVSNSSSQFENSNSVWFTERDGVITPKRNALNELLPFGPLVIKNLLYLTTPLNDVFTAPEFRYSFPESEAEQKRRCESSGTAYRAMDKFSTVYFLDDGVECVNTSKEECDFDLLDTINSNDHSSPRTTNPSEPINNRDMSQVQQFVSSIPSYCGTISPDQVLQLRSVFPDIDDEVVLGVMAGLSADSINYILQLRNNDPEAYRYMIYLIQQQFKTVAPSPEPGDQDGSDSSLLNRTTLGF